MEANARPRRWNDKLKKLLEAEAAEHLLGGGHHSYSEVIFCPIPPLDRSESVGSDLGVRVPPPPPQGIESLSIFPAFVSGPSKCSLCKFERVHCGIGEIDVQKLWKLFINDAIYLFISFRKSTPPQNHHINILMSNSEQLVNDLVEEFTVQN